MFRTVTVYSGEKISVDQNRMVVSGESGDQFIPIEDVYSLVIDNPRTLLTVPVITRLTSSGAHIILCDEKHMPSSVILPHSLHYHPLTVLRKQLSMPDEIKDRIWDRIVKQKIINQAKVLQICTNKRERVSRMLELADEVVNGDEGNREGISARIFFRELYGFEFVRMYDDATNAALNYGYTVIRSSVAKTLVAYGYNCVYGVHHINESNPFNLADDIMEPLRPAAYRT
ncbi:MAG: type II CRISPR-associated endonuclease Cas1 [Clostridia bacterium]|nr:type II CRISPR-associated endonuclease Cas1 [Clostridia bacterium]